MKKLFLFLVSYFCLTGCSVFGLRTEENPKYEVLIRSENMEIRRYSPYIVATTRVDGSFKDTQSKAFKILAGYIFGDNETKEKISMTAPVTMNMKENESEKIAMTAPVVQSPTENGWEMSFMMPSKFAKIEDLPKPKDNRIIFDEIPSKTIAVIKFTGFWTEEKNQKMADLLKEWLKTQNQYKESSAPKFAGYDPPWTLPFLRRNEIMIEIEKR